LVKARYNQRVPGLFPEPINASTRYCAVYGHPVRHSASPAMQNAGIAAQGLNWRYLAFEVHPDDLRAALEGAKRMCFAGVNLTVPHKLLAVEMVDVLDESARAWGAVNTVRFEARNAGGEWRPVWEFAEVPREVRSHGFNTDADAITRALREDLGLKVSGAKVLLLGSGGAGRTAALKLAADGVAEMFLVNRTRSKAEAVAQEIHQHWPAVRLTMGYPPGEVDLVLNATSLGLRADDALPYDEKAFTLRRARAVYDMIYRPAETPLLKAAKAAGCRVANGLGMLLYQGAKALELWSGQAAPVEVMRRALEENVYG
jgi:shikimate dehydrogenase